MVLEAALEISPNVNVIYFTLGNIYAVNYLICQVVISADVIFGLTAYWRVQES